MIRFHVSRADGYNTVPRYVFLWLLWDCKCLSRPVHCGQNVTTCSLSSPLIASPHPALPALEEVSPLVAKDAAAAQTARTLFSAEEGHRAGLGKCSFSASCTIS